MTSSTVYLILAIAAAFPSMAFIILIEANGVKHHYVLFLGLSLYVCITSIYELVHPSPSRMCSAEFHPMPSGEWEFKYHKYQGEKVSICTIVRKNQDAKGAADDN